jgi:hypothetical protein
MDFWSSEDDGEDIAEWLGQSYEDTAVGTQEVAEVVSIGEPADGEQAS